MGSAGEDGWYRGYAKRRRCCYYDDDYDDEEEEEEEGCGGGHTMQEVGMDGRLGAPVGGQGVARAFWSWEAWPGCLHAARQSVRCPACCHPARL